MLYSKPTHVYVQDGRMPLTFLKYPLANGFIHNWLVAGPVFTREEEPPALQPFLSDAYPFTAAPVDLGPLEGAPAAGSSGSPPLAWRYARCREDHYVDFTPETARKGHLIGYCSAIISSAAEQEISLSLTASGRADLWM